jgi:SWI/SNF-related matrix-associated actin-dependent regulator 1 of chromatin subfamily A
MMVSKALPHQKEGAFDIETFGGRIGIFWEMAGGKTYMSLKWFYRNRDVAWPMLVVCPTNIRKQWAKEAMKHFGLTSKILRSHTPYPLMHKPKVDVLIIGYDVLQYWQEWLINRKIRLIVIDECQNISNKNIRWRALKNISESCDVPYILPLSGTPQLNRPIELWNVINLLAGRHAKYAMRKKWPRVLRVFREFADAFCDPKRTRYGMQYKGATDLKRLNKLLKKYIMLRLTEEDINKDQLPKLRRVIPVKLSDPAQYAMIVRSFVRWVDSFASARALRAAKAMQITKIQYMKHLAARLKMSAVLKWLDRFLKKHPNEKLCIFALHKDIIRILKKHYEHRYYLIDGSVPMEERNGIVDRFNRKDGRRIFIIQLRVGGVGLNIKARNSAILELWWNPGTHLQVEGRTRGKNRGIEGKRSRYYYLIGEGTIEVKLCSLIERRQEIFNAVMDGKAGAKGMDIYNLLTKALTEETKGGLFLD